MSKKPLVFKSWFQNALGQSDSLIYQIWVSQLYDHSGWFIGWWLCNTLIGINWWYCFPYGHAQHCILAFTQFSLEGVLGSSFLKRKIEPFSIIVFTLRCCKNIILKLLVVHNALDQSHFFIFQISIFQELFTIWDVFLYKVT